MSTVGARRSLGRTVLRGTLIGGCLGAIAVVLVTAYWLGLNVYLESQKTAPGVPDVVTPVYVAALYFLVYVIPVSVVGAVLGLAWWLVARVAHWTAAKSARGAGSGASAIRPIDNED